MVGIFTGNKGRLISPREAAEIAKEQTPDYEDWEKWFDSFEDYRKWMNKFGIFLTRLKSRQKITKEKFLIQAVSALEDLNPIFNSEVERLREWFGYHYPEYKEEKHSKFVKEVWERRRRENFTGFEDSVGLEFSDEDEEAFHEFADLTKKTLDVQNRLEKYVEKLMDEVAPNVKSILGPILGAKVIAMFGSLEKMAKSPASAIQLIGAEKSLFRHLKSGKKSKPPKYGIIYRHPKIQGVKPELRGKIARLIASKASLAAKIDFFSGKLNPEIKERMEEEFRRMIS